MTVTLMRGKIGSGKTHKAKKLCAETGAQYLSVDSFTEKLFGNQCPGREKLLEAEAAILALYAELAVDNAKKGIPTVIDHGFWRRLELDNMVAYLVKHGVAYKVLTITADFETRLNRVASRVEGKTFDIEKLKKFDDYYEE